MKTLLRAFAALTIFLVVGVSTALAMGYSLFVIQPIGAIPDGVTAIVWTNADVKLIDSPDAMCDRKTGNVSLFCRASSIAAVVREDGEIVARLPYSDLLYGLTGAPEVYR